MYSRTKTQAGIYAIIFAIILLAGCRKKEEELKSNLPSDISVWATNINPKSATLNGSLSGNSLSTDIIFEYGTTLDYGNSVVATQTPVTNPIATMLRANISDLTIATLYHFRVKATNPLGTDYGNDQTFTTVLTDIEGNTYGTVTIGAQEWMQENLKTSRYRNGDMIVTTSSPTADITIEDTPKYQWSSTVAGYGRAYTYYAITDDRKICPEGWHVPTDDDWTVLTSYLKNNNYGYGGSGDDIAKSLAATNGWTADPIAGNVGNDQPNNNSSGFTGFPGGGRYSNGMVNFLTFHAIWWSSTESTASGAYFRCIGYLPGVVFRGVFNKSYGLSVRCLKD